MWVFLCACAFFSFLVSIPTHPYPNPSPQDRRSLPFDRMHYCMYIVCTRGTVLYCAMRGARIIVDIPRPGTLLISTHPPRSVAPLLVMLNHLPRSILQVPESHKETSRRRDCRQPWQPSQTKPARRRGGRRGQKEKVNP